MRWLTALLLCYGCAMDEGIGTPRGLDSDAGLDSASNGCLSGDSPTLQLGSAGPAFEAWQESDPLVIETSSEGGLSLPFAIASRSTPRRASLNAQFTLADGTPLATATDLEVLLACHADGQLVSEPQRLTVSWQGDAFELFGAPAKLNVSIAFANGQQLSQEVTAEITF